MKPANPWRCLRIGRWLPTRAMHLLAATLFAAVWVVSSQRSSLGAEPFMFRARVDGRMIEGKPLAWSAEQMLLLGRDGQLYDFDPKEAKEAKKTSPRFVGYSALEMKRGLQQEFGKAFDVSTTQHYLVVHPRGERDQWANRFEDLYKRFTHYFRVRGFTLQEPPYPMVAIVYRDQAEYYRRAAASGTPMRPGTLGHYDPTSNRVFLFDSTAGSGDGDWAQNAETIIHEATHQTAYNVGIHQRFAEAPRWLVEGLATMFEARGVWDALADESRATHINHYQLREFRDYVASRHKPGSVMQLLASDQLFRSDPDGAYAEAWGLSFYLSETQPRLYAAYLQKTASRAPFSDYRAAERVADFQAFFGKDMKLLEAKFLRYMEAMN